MTTVITRKVCTKCGEPKVAMGASPEQAIEIAAMFDPQTALPVEYVKCKRVA